MQLATVFNPQNTNEKTATLRELAEKVADHSQFKSREAAKETHLASSSWAGNIGTSGGEITLRSDRCCMMLIQQTSIALDLSYVTRSCRNTNQRDPLKGAIHEAN